MVEKGKYLMPIHWLHAAIVMLQMGGTQLLALRNLIVALRPIVIVAFLFFCPGVIAVRFLKLREPVVAFVLALALSLAIDAFLAGILLYAGWWSPVRTFNILAWLCLATAAGQWLGKHTNLAMLRKLLAKPLDRTRSE
jgi:hypothetical protein